MIKTSLSGWMKNLPEDRSPNTYFVAHQLKSGDWRVRVQGRIEVILTDRFFQAIYGDQELVYVNTPYEWGKV